MNAISTWPSRVNAWLDRIYANRVYQRLSGPLVIVALLFAMVGVGAAYLNGRADAERTQALLKCTDDRDSYVAQSSQRLRDVTQDWNDAVSHKSAAVKRLATALADGFDGIGDFSGILVTAIATGPQDTPDPAVLADFLDAVTRIQTTSPKIQHRAEIVSVRAEQLVDASRALRQARKANPVVPPASEVCATGVFVPPKP